MLLLSLFHKIALPTPANDISRSATSTGEAIKSFGEILAAYFKKPGIVQAIMFMLLFRLPEAQLVKLLNPFLLDSHEAGGLALSTEQIGVTYGTIGVIGLIIGGIAGGIAISRKGLKYWLWPMALALTLPCAFYCYLAMIQPTDFILINAGIFIEQFGYGFGFTAYMLYLMYFSDGEFKTAHYSLCTAFMALSMMIPGMVAGYIQELLGYTKFFGFVMICCLVTVFVTFILKVDPEYGKKS